MTNVKISILGSQKISGSHLQRNIYQDENGIFDLGIRHKEHCSVSAEMAV